MINTDYCYCSGIGCKIRDKCKRYLTNPPDIPLWWIDAATYAQHMGNDIAALLECDAVVLLDGWATSKGCRLEHRAAIIYNKSLYIDLDQIPNNDKKE